MSVIIETIAWNGWGSCYRISNDTVELIVTADVGPRVLHYTFLDGVNVFNVLEEDAGQTGGDAFRLYGGHRFWHAPEEMPRTYYPDNAPVTVERAGDTVQFIAPEETPNGVQKTLEVALSPSGSKVTVRHLLTNTGRWDVELAPWALSVMAAGGTAIVPLPPRGSHDEILQPTSNLTLWAYTDLSDPRWTLTEKYILLRQDGGDVGPQKIGASVPEGWLAYVLEETLFVKRFAYAPGPYPDMNSSAEVFTNSWMLELESLGHTQRIAPSATITHTEQWTLHRGVTAPATADEVDTQILPFIAE
jgi:hypothetical protein